MNPHETSLHQDAADQTRELEGRMEAKHTLKLSWDSMHADNRFEVWDNHDKTSPILCIIESGNAYTPDKIIPLVKLFCAAPSLLRACQLAAVRLGGGTQAEREFNAGVAQECRKAIALATGREG